MTRAPKQVAEIIKPEGKYSLFDSPQRKQVGSFDPAPVAKRPHARQLSDTVIVIDDKGLMVVNRDGTPITGGFRIVFEQYELHNEGGAFFQWASVNTGAIRTQFDHLRDIEAYCREQGLRMEYVLVGAKWVKG